MAGILWENAVEPLVCLRKWLVSFEITEATVILHEPTTKWFLRPLNYNSMTLKIKISEIKATARDTRLCSPNGVNPASASMRVAGLSPGFRTKSAPGLEQDQNFYIFGLSVTEHANLLMRFY